MVVGVDRWREHFIDHADRYVLVGGVACDLLMDDAGLEFRATKDLDMVLIIELLDADFASAFWEFVEAGGYEVRAKSEGGNLYRFSKPAEPDYPHMIELFSRAPAGFDLPAGGRLTPLPIDETVASLSAILLDEGYYAFLREHVVDHQGLPLLGPEALIPFKARAHLDLHTRREAGGTVDGKDIRKHRSDVFKVLQLLAPTTTVALPELLAGDMRTFIDAVAADEGFKPSDLKLRGTAAELLDRLKAVYGL